jgi:hypothetical protein
MTVLIREIVSEVVLTGGSEVAEGAPAPAPSEVDEAMVERIVRRATERVLEHLRYEWDA